MEEERIFWGSNEVTEKKIDCGGMGVCSRPLTCEVKLIRSSFVCFCNYLHEIGHSYCFEVVIPTNTLTISAGSIERQLLVLKHPFQLAVL